MTASLPVMIDLPSSLAATTDHISTALMAYLLLGLQGEWCAEEDCRLSCQLEMAFGNIPVKRRDVDRAMQALRILCDLLIV